MRIPAVAVAQEKEHTAAHSAELFQLHEEQQLSSSHSPGLPPSLPPGPNLLFHTKAEVSSCVRTESTKPEESSLWKDKGKMLLLEGRALGDRVDLGQGDPFNKY
jgi:hypothetical protein